MRNNYNGRGAVFTVDAIPSSPAVGASGALQTGSFASDIAPGVEYLSSTDKLTRARRLIGSGNNNMNTEGNLYTSEGSLDGRISSSRGAPRPGPFGSQPVTDIGLLASGRDIPSAQPIGVKAVRGNNNFDSNMNVNVGERGLGGQILTDITSPRKPASDIMSSGGVSPSIGTGFDIANNNFNDMNENVVGKRPRGQISPYSSGVPLEIMASANAGTGELFSDGGSVITVDVMPSGPARGALQTGSLESRTAPGLEYLSSAGNIHHFHVICWFPL